MPPPRNQVGSGALPHPPPPPPPPRIVAVILYNLYCFIKENNIYASASGTSPTVFF